MIFFVPWGDRLLRIGSCGARRLEICMSPAHVFGDHGLVDRLGLRILWPCAGRRMIRRSSPR